MTQKIKPTLVTVVVVLLVLNSFFTHIKLKKTLASSKDVIEAIGKEYDRMKAEKDKLAASLEVEKKLVEEMVSTQDSLKEELASANAKLAEKTSELEKSAIETDSLKEDMKNMGPGSEDPAKNRAEELRQRLEQKLKITTSGN